MRPPAFQRHQIEPPIGLPDIFTAYGDVVADLLGFVVSATVVYVVGRILVFPVVVRVVRSRNRNNPTLQTATETYLQVLLVGLAALAGVVGAGYGSLLADSAILIAAVTFVLGVAGKEVIGSLFSGFFLVTDPDFNVGDWISWPGGEGAVEAVDFRVTRVRTINNETITVPNTELTTNALTRPYGRDQFRVTEEVVVAYDDDVERALYELRTVAGEDDRVLEEPGPTARIRTLGENAVTLEGVFWIGDPRRVDVVEVRADFRRRVKDRFDAAGLTLGPPSGRELSGRVAVEAGAGDGE
jgi:small-conductance mechanosensitive channel